MKRGKVQVRVQAHEKHKRMSVKLEQNAQQQERRSDAQATICRGFDGHV